MAVGTARVNRKEMPVALKSKVQRGEMVFRLRGPLLAIKWCDKRDVVMLSTKHKPSKSITNQRDRNVNCVEKPSCVLDYNDNMGGVDTSDQMNKYYGFSCKTMKWWVKLLFYLINLAVTNAYILHKNSISVSPWTT